MARVSVLMGIYNCAPYLQEALDSLYAQTYKDITIILCDDGSTDETYAIAHSNAKSHNNIILIRNERNMGLNYTLNRCLEYANSEYCARMDGDDISMPTRIEKEVAFLDAHPEYAIVSTPMKYFDEDGVFRTGMVKVQKPSAKDFAKGTPFCHAPCLVRKNAYDVVGGYSDEPRLRRVEDYHLWIKMYAHGFKGYMLAEPLYLMRDDRNAQYRRNFQNRKNEAYVRYLACKTFKLPVLSYVHCLRPILVGLLPNRIYSFLHRRR